MNASFPPIRPANPFENADDDAIDAAWEALRAECEAEFEDWQRADYDNREFADFSNWIVSKARWNRPNRFECALNWHERALLEMGSKAA